MILITVQNLMLKKTSVLKLWNTTLIVIRVEPNLWPVGSVVNHSERDAEVLGSIPQVGHYSCVVINSLIHIGKNSHSPGLVIQEYG